MKVQFMQQEKQEDLDDAIAMKENLIIHSRTNGWIAHQGKMKVLSVSAEYDPLNGNKHNLECNFCLEFIHILNSTANLLI